MEQILLEAKAHTSANGSDRSASQQSSPSDGQATRLLPDASRISKKLIFLIDSAP